MMTSNFAPHAGMAQHPGMPHGQPMPGGIPHPQGMAGAMQMHPGVSGPHGQVSQAGAMMGIQPGMQMPGGPSAHAMQHLVPNGGQQQMMQPGMQQHNVNHQLMLQQSAQQRAMMQRQQMLQQQRMTQQPGQPGFNPQWAALQQQMPPHMQQQAMHNAQIQQIQAHALRQEAARAQNMAAQQQHAQHLAMQQAHSQGSNQGQPTPHPNQPPMRPASAIGTTGMEARPSPAPTAAPPTSQPGPQNQAANQASQPQTAGASAPQGQPTAGAQQQSQGQNNGQQGGPQNAAQAQQRANNQQAMMQAQQMRQQAAANQSGKTTLAAFNFVNKLGSFPSEGNTLAYWQRFVNDHFTPEGTMRLTLKSNDDKPSKQYEILKFGLPRYLWTQFKATTGIQQVRYILDGVEEKRINETHTTVLASKSQVYHIMRDGMRLEWNGELRMIYVGDKVDHISFVMQDWHIFLPMAKLKELCALASPNQNRSPKLTKNQAKGKLNQQAPQQNEFDMRKLPPHQIGELGLHKTLQGHLEIGETMNHLQPAIQYSCEHPELTPSDALSGLAAIYEQQQQQQGRAHQGQQQGGPIQGAFPPGGLQGRPSIVGGMGASPAMTNVGLPNGNMQATPSPHQANMAPPMQPSMSQQGSNASMSSNTSPNVGGPKRRRSVATGVKDEDAPNGSGKVKQSPRMASNPKRLKNG